MAPPANTPPKPPRRAKAIAPAGSAKGVTGQPPQFKRRRKGFESAISLLGGQIRVATESRGFAIARLLTHWPDIVGADLAAIARPVNVSYAKGGFGATLTVLTTGAQAPILQAQLPVLRDRVNACYGYNAISHVHITQSAPTGFAEGRANFDYGPKARNAPPPVDEGVRRDAAQIVADVQDSQLRVALESLAQTVLSKTSKPQ